MGSIRVLFIRSQGIQGPSLESHSKAPQVLLGSPKSSSALPGSPGLPYKPFVGQEGQATGGPGGGQEGFAFVINFFDFL